jgi:pimeloyl-ACP methyl ester carboxylesterase
MVPGRDGAMGAVAGTQGGDGRTVGTGGAQAPTRYLTQRISWRSCLTAEEIEELVSYGFPGGVGRLECGTFRAPLDWSSPGTQDVTVAVSRLRATSPGPGPRQVVFTNPGGPGLPGVSLPLVFLAAGRERLLAEQDVYGIDPRGTGGSTNVTCGLRPMAGVDHRDRSPENLGLIIDTAALAERYCDVTGGALIRHVTTANTVRDLDLLRQLVAVERINWIGYSAGTWLGAHYAGFFPGRTGRFVLDSNVEFTASWQRIALNQPMGFERRFRSDFAGWAARHHGTYRLGTTPVAVRGFYERVRADLAEHPVGGYSGPALDQTIAEGLYTGTGFIELAGFLGELRTILDLVDEGDLVAATRVHRTSLARRPRLWSGGRRSLSPVDTPAAVRPLTSGATTVDASEATGLAVTCGDTRWVGGTTRLLQDSRDLGSRFPLTGYRLVEEPCMFWDAPREPLPTPTGDGVPPILMIQSEHDPATPLEGARRAANGFAGARLLVVRDEGDHGLYASGNACVDDAVEDYLLAGTLPARGATCPGLPLPVPEAGADSLDGIALDGITPDGLTSPDAAPRRPGNPLDVAGEIADLVTVGAH